MFFLRFVAVLFSWLLLFILTVALYLILLIVCYLIIAFNRNRDIPPRHALNDQLFALMDEIVELCHFFDARPKIGVNMNGWELVAATRSTNRGYRARQFSPVINTSTSNGFDDPFWPNYVDYVYMVEIREHGCITALWDTVNIWQVSLLNGGQKKLHQFEHRLNFQLGAAWNTAFILLDHVFCFQNAGVIMINVRNWLFVHDLKFGKSGKYQLMNIWAYFRKCRAVVSITCLGRIAGIDGSTVGWRIRVLATRDRSILTGQPNHEVTNLRACLVNMVFELRERATMIHKEEVMFGWFDDDVGIFPDLTLTPVRTKTAFGIQAIGLDEQDGPVVIFDEVSQGYAYFANFNQFQNSDAALDRYMTNQPPINDEDKSYLVVVISDNECIACSKDGTVYRRPFRLQPMKYSMAKAVFRSNPQLRYQITADQFRQATGIQGMNAHFDK